MRRELVFVTFSVLFVGLGCQTKVELPPPGTSTMIAGPVIFNAEDEYTPKVPPILKIAKSSEGSRVKKGETLEITLTIEVPMLSYVPNTLMLGFAKAKSAGTTQPFVFQKKIDDRSYLFRAKTEVKSAPGRYLIWAEAITPLIIEANPKTGRKKTVDLMKCESNVIEIEVKP